MRGVSPRTGAALLALICIGLALGYAFSAETPVGRVEGRVVIADTKKPLSDVEVFLTPVDTASSETDDGAATTREAVTIEDGRFSLSRIAAGKYHAAASTRAHQIDSAVVEVTEGQTTTVTLALKRSQPDLQVAQHQHVFATSEKPFLPIRGYVDGKKPKGEDRVHVRVFATRLSEVLRSDQAASSLERIGRAYETKPSRLPGELLRPSAGAAPRLLWEHDLPIAREADREGFFHKRIPLETRGAGLYLVDVQHGKRAVCSWILATDTALIVKRASRQLLAYTTDMKTGQPIPDAEVRVYRGGRVVAAERADARGVAELDVPIRGDDSRLMTVALRGADEAVLGRNDYFYEEQGDFVVHAYTDRPLYRPGQTLSYKGIARRREKSGASRRYDVPSGERVTVEIRDPGGERVLRETHMANRFGSFSGSVELSAEAATGTYSLVSEIRGEKHTSEIVVAAYRKPEFAVTVTPERKRYVRGEEVSMTVDAGYYFGAPVAGAKVKYYIFRDTDWSAEYPGDYASEDDEEPSPLDGYEGYYGEMVSEGEATLDENGRAVVRFRAEVPTEAGSDAPQEQIFTLDATVADDAGRTVQGQGRVRVSAGDFRLSVQPEGYVAEPGQPMTILVKARDHEGRPLANIALEMEAVYVAWNPKTRTDETQPLATERATTGPDGGAVMTIRPPRPGEVRLIAGASDAKGRRIRARGNVWAASDEGGDLQTEYADLSLHTDKRRYQPGETARVLVNTARTGQTALLTIEGDRIHETISVPITKRSTVVRVPVRAEYGPNVLLAACYVRDKKFAQSETPLRVTLPGSEVTVKVTADRARFEPGDAVTYQVRTTDARGRPAPCEFSLGVVDESIYALREEDPRALRRAFYPRRYNQVTTSYSFAVEYLGDADKAEPDIEARTKFLDTAYWQPALRTDEAGRATIRVPLPDNLTTWRATVSACTLDTAVGREITKVVVTKPFLVRLEKPRFLTQGDRSRLLALVHNETGAQQTALVRLVATGLRRGGDETQTLTLAPGQVGQASWPVTADGIGEARLRVTAWTAQNSGGGQYTDGLETTLPIRPHGRDHLASVAGTLVDAPKTETLTLDEKAIPAASRLVVRVTPSVRGALVGALDYLIGYPYGCTEQTMSRFLPDILVQRLQRQTGGTLTPKQAAELPKMVRDGLSRLYRFQNNAGGWGWWEHDESDPFMTAYVLYGLSLARDTRYRVSGDILRRGREAAAKLLEKAKPEDKPFLLYALALAGDADTPRRTRGKLAPPGKLPPDALAYLVLLNKRLGGDGGDALAELNRRAVSGGGLLHWENPEERWDSSTRMTTALGLRALLAANPGDPRIPAVLRWLMTNRTDDYWGSTRDTAVALAALVDYLAANPSDAAPTGSLVVRVNGRMVQTYALTPETANERELVLRVPASELRAGNNRITLERTGGTSTVFYAATLRQTVALDPIPALATDGLTVEREYRRVLPRKIGLDSWRLGTEPTNNRLAQNDRLRVRLTLTTTRDLSYVLIEDAFPSGCEVTERGSEYETVEWGHWYSSVDIRDDRVAFFARTLPKGKHVIEYNLRAQTPGSYRALPTLLQPMYVPEIRAESAGARVEVR